MTRGSSRRSIDRLPTEITKLAASGGALDGVGSFWDARRMRRFPLFFALVLVACGETKTETVTVPGECADGSVDATADGTADAATDGPVDAPAETAADGALDTSSPPDAAPDAADGATDTSDGGPGCTIKEGGDLCNKMPKFVGTQVVDGSDAEFCDLDATVVAIKGGTPPPGYGVTTNPSLPTKLKARMGWSSLGLHAHLHVDDPIVVAGGPGAIPLDEVNLYVGGNAPFYGPFDGDKTDKGLFRIILTPEGKTGAPGFDGVAAASAVINFCIPDTTTGLPATVKCSPSLYLPLGAPAKWAYRSVDGGYEFELFLPWTTLGRATAPVKGESIATHLQVSSCDEATASLWGRSCSAPKFGVAAQPLKTTSGSPPCGGPPAGLYCDDRTWCSPDLQ